MCVCPIAELRQGSEVHLTSRSGDTIHGANPAGSSISTQQQEGEKSKNWMGDGVKCGEAKEKRKGFHLFKIHIFLSLFWFLRSKNGI